MNAAPGITLRPETEADGSFRFALFCDVRANLEPMPGLDAPLLDPLMRHQFRGQDATYRAAYPTARFEIVEADGTPIGRMVVDEGRELWTLVDIALLRAWRGRGIGTRLVSRTLADARIAGTPVHLQVLTRNTGAARLYARLGFSRIAAGDVADHMVWTPA